MIEALIWGVGMGQDGNRSYLKTRWKETGPIATSQNALKHAPNMPTGRIN